ncbi:uncharacterized protein MELLADRAFT_61414 [Melampsora larici-populina 98AG31]|uniref:Uncharacterized protein n=1 Tax=Melampsora larici-populina (strain 98AG31 / pathotype 3-4-7) TaxID=747676 RepID=F4RET4_MELLP|nr:uncharacterized protein MELLADRAFT_61414 [Melampsora larici-populina 98AG31]EGG09156.1 hypothetical protein MELLADRAFT_61414 [Melampsora larici-populina 98AG31]
MSNCQDTTENHDTQSLQRPNQHHDTLNGSILESHNGRIDQISSSFDLQDEAISTTSSADGNIPSILADLNRAQDLADSIDSRLDSILSQLGDITAELEQNLSGHNNTKTSEGSQDISKPT